MCGYKHEKKEEKNKKKCAPGHLSPDTPFLLSKLVKTALIKPRVLEARTTYVHTDRQTVIATDRLNWLRGQFCENSRLGYTRLENRHLK